MNYKFLIIISLSIFTFHLCRAGGFNVGNGGDGIYCSESRYIDGDNETPGFIDLGHHFFSLEHFRILQFKNLNDIESEELRRITLMSSPDLRKSFYKKIEINPDFLQLFKETEKFLKFEKNSYLVPGLLPDIPDDSLTEKLPLDCVKFQAIIRQKTTFYWNMRYAQNIPNWEKEILRLHEIIYYIGVTKYSHANSRKTQNLIISLMTSENKEILDLAFNEFLN